MRTGAIKINGKIVRVQSPGANPAEGLEDCMSTGESTSLTSLVLGIRILL